MASKFLTLKQKNAERIIEALFSGLPDDDNLKMALRVMNGLEDESVLDELRVVNEENMKMLNQKFELSEVAPVTDVVYDAHGNTIEVPMQIEEPKKESPVISNGDNTSE